MKIVSVVSLLLLAVHSCEAFGITNQLSLASRISARAVPSRLYVSQQEQEAAKSSSDDGVIELVDATEEEPKAEEDQAVAPFLSQGEIQPETLQVDFQDPKQTRVIIYIILSLLPVLFLIPLMLGSREFLPAIIPMDDLPPVQI